jgi:hypothetical protein
MALSDTIKWLTTLTPARQVVAILLIGIATVGGVVVNRDNGLKTCEMEKTELRDEMARVVHEKDSTIFANQEKSNRELHAYMVKANDELKIRIEELDEINAERRKILLKNKQIVESNKKTLKELTNEK